MSATHSYSGCTHTHLYNWMGTPQITANAQAGIGDAVVAYGYAMSGTNILRSFQPQPQQFL